MPDASLLRAQHDLQRTVTALGHECPSADELERRLRRAVARAQDDPEPVSESSAIASSGPGRVAGLEAELTRCLATLRELTEPDEFDDGTRQLIESAGEVWAECWKGFKLGE